MSELGDLIAKNKAADRAELDASMERDQKVHDTLDRCACRGCHYVWSTVAGIRPRPTIWIPQAQAWWHLRCWQRHQEQAGRLK